MAFNFYAPPILNPAQSGAMPDIIGNLLSGYSDVYKAKMLPQELIKKQLENKWYEPNIKSQIGLRGAQAGSAGAHANLLREQLKGAQIENQYMPQMKEATIQQLQAQADKARLLQMIREHMMGGESPQGNTASMPMFGGHGMPTYSEGQPGQGMSQPNPDQAMPNFSQSAVAMQALGLGKPQVFDVNGKYVAITPFGNIDTGVQGLNEKQKVLAKEDAKKISSLEDIVLNNSAKTDTFNLLNQNLSNPIFEQMRQHPILGRYELSAYKKFGTKEQQQMAGQVETLMGNIIKDSARDFAGQFRVGEQALLNNMKPNPGDTLDVMKGKSEALTYLNTIMTKRAEIEADYMRNYNMTALQAKIAADKTIDPKAIKKEIHTILHPSSSKKSNFSQNDLEYTAKKHGMTVDEVRQKLESR